MAPPSNQVIHRRKLGTIPYTAGGRASIELDRDGVLLQLRLRLKYTITNGGSAAPTGLKFLFPFRLMRRIEVIVGGRDTVWSISGEQLAAKVWYENQVAPYGNITAVTAGAGSTTSVDLVLPLDFTLPLGVRPDDTGLDTRGIGQLACYVTWASGASDLFGTTNSATISNVTCSLEGKYMLNIPNNRVYLVRALDTMSRQLTGTASNWDMTLDRGTGLVYRSFTTFTTVDDVGVSDILDPGSIRVEAGSFIFVNQDAVQIKAENAVELNLGSTILTGVYHLPLTAFGQLVNGINTGPLDADLKVIFDPATLSATSGTNMINVLREAVRPLKLA
ncbi:MAG: hypothetical protein ACM31L_02715 [Actinomycetota bacterium]